MIAVFVIDSVFCTNLTCLALLSQCTRTARASMSVPPCPSEQRHSHGQSQPTHYLTFSLYTPVLTGCDIKEDDNAPTSLEWPSRVLKG